jgi:hypothetical protein
MINRRGDRRCNPCQADLSSPSRSKFVHHKIGIIQKRYIDFWSIGICRHPVISAGLVAIQCSLAKHSRPAGAPVAPSRDRSVRRLKCPKEGASLGSVFTSHTLSPDMELPQWSSAAPIGQYSQGIAQNNPKNLGLGRPIGLGK